MNISKNSNEKLGCIPSLNLPVCVCGNAPCRNNGCYACKGHWNYKNVQDSLHNNLGEFATDPKKFFNDIIEELNNGLVVYRYFRWFASGDIVNMTFLEGMVKVAKACKLTTFLCFTKKFAIVNKYLKDGGKLPKNLKIVYSHWDKDFPVENPFGLPTAFVRFKKANLNPLIPQTAFPCSGKCEKCLACWKLENGQSVVFNKH